ncbi:toxic anion resistance protein [Ralstonia pseudosolanacearum]|uniref:toxic anion resistance protein n=1 Tax=Ralstonia pseudosolanacearum TaxID=1310165 RepID=UPI003CF8D7CB
MKSTAEVASMNPTNLAFADINSASVQRNLTVVVPTSELANLGLTEADLPAITDLATRIDASNPLSISQFGREVSEHTSKYADQLLEQINNKDLGDSGAKLTQIVLSAKSLGRHALSDRRSRIPVVGPIIDRFRQTKDKCVAHFQTTREQIDGLIGEVTQTQGGLQDRVGDLETMFTSVKEEHRLLGIHIAAGKIKLDEMRSHVDGMRTQDLSPALSQDISDMQMMISNLDKRIGDLQVIQHSALQTLPEIRMIQADNLALVEKFHTIKELTVPMWKRQFTLALSLNEQKNAVELAGAIDDATNEFAVRQAELLKKNSVATAKANQRLVIDVSTLERVNQTLISTVEEVVKVHQDGQKNRRQLEGRLLEMRGELKTKLVGRAEGQGAQG